MEFFTKRPASRPAHKMGLSLEQLESRQLLSASPLDLGIAAVSSVIGSQSSNPHHFATVGKTLYFTANDGVHGRELWRTDGTVATTSLVKDVNPGSASSSLHYLTQLNGVLYFGA